MERNGMYMESATLWQSCVSLTIAGQVEHSMQVNCQEKSATVYSAQYNEPDTWLPNNAVWW